MRGSGGAVIGQAEMREATGSSLRDPSAVQRLLGKTSWERRLVGLSLGTVSGANEMKGFQMVEVSLG